MIFFFSWTKMVAMGNDQKFVGWDYNKCIHLLSRVHTHARLGMQTNTNTQIRWIDVFFERQICICIKLFLVPFPPNHFFVSKNILFYFAWWPMFWDLISAFNFSTKFAFRRKHTIHGMFNVGKPWTWWEREIDTRRCFRQLFLLILH